MGVVTEGKNNRLSISGLVLEAFFVVLGVFLAIAANEWREQKDREAHAAAAREGILAEIEENKKAVEAAFSYHAELLKTLNQFAQDKAAGKTEREYPERSVFYRGFAQPARVVTTAWDAARETDALRYMNYEDVLQFSQIYALQRNYELQAQIVGQVFYGAMLAEGVEGIQRNYAHLSEIIGTFWYREKQLVESYQQGLDSLNSGVKAPDSHP